MAVEQILKSWLRTKYTDNNTLRSTFGSGTTLTVPDTSNSLAQDTDINPLLASLRAMQSNEYLRYSALWSSVNLTNVADGNLIAQSKKTSIDNLIADLKAMCANYSKTPICAYNAANATAFSQNSTNATAFSQNSGNVTRFSQNSGNVSSFSQNSSNASYGFNHSFNERYTFNRKHSTNFVFRSGSGGFFRDSDSTSFGFFGSNSPSFGFFGSNSPTFGFFASNSPTFGHNATNSPTFTQNAANFSRQFNYSFIVKSDKTTVSHSNIGS